MRRAIWNLVCNAIKYGDERTSIGVHVTSSAGFVELAVHNHGPVIAAEDRAVLFEPFSRAISVHAAAQRGWGLGLTLVKGCVEAHGGVVKIESEIDTGTTFTLRFPCDARPFQPRADLAPPLA
jgi:signal transduction histidine kinase